MLTWQCQGKHVTCYPPDVLLCLFVRRAEVSSEDEGQRPAGDGALQRPD